MSVAGLGVLWMLVAVVVVALGVAVAVFGWDRYRPRRGHARAPLHPTNEVFIDPETGRRTRVWFDPRTGAREYREEG